MTIKILIGLLIVFNAGLVSAMSSSNYTISISDCSYGGGRASGQYRIDDTVGQGVMGTGGIRSSNYNLSTGIITILLPQSGTSTFVEPNLEKALVYPNPYNADKHAGIEITFDKLAGNSTIQIFTIAGELVREIRVESSSQKWDVCNESGEKVASGIYIYLIKDPAGNRKVGKLGVIR